MINHITGLPNRISQLNEDVIINGSLTINNGNQGAGLVLTSDANGLATWQFNSSANTYTTGVTFNPATYDLAITRNDAVSYTTNLSILASDMNVTGGTYDSITGNATFTNNSGNTFQVTGFLTGMTDTYVTGFTYSNNVLTISQNAGQPDLSVLIDVLSGLTVNGNLNVTTFSATTYQNLPLDILVTGGTYNNTTGTATFKNNTGGTFTTTGFYTGSTDAYWVSGSSGNFSLHAINDSGLDATGDYAVAEGNNTHASGNTSHAEGIGSFALGYISHAEGYNTTASGDTSHAEGTSTSAIGDYSHSEGGSTLASGGYSHAEGALTIASGIASHAEGNTTTSSGYFSHAGGIDSVASGSASFVHGSGSTAGGTNTIVFGADITGTTSDTTYVDALNIKTLSSGTSITNLGLDASGFVVSATTGSGSGLSAYGYAVGQDSTTIGADSDVVFDLGATIFPNTGMTVPSSGGTGFTITTTGDYEFNFYVVSTTHDAFATTPLVFAIYINGTIATAGGNAFEYRGTFTTTDANQSVRGEGIIALTAGDVVTLHNRTNTVTDTVTVASTQTGVEASPNRTLTLKKIN